MDLRIKRISAFISCAIIILAVALFLFPTAVLADELSEKETDSQEEINAAYSELETSELLKRVFDYYYSRPQDLSMLNYRLQHDLFTQYEECLPEFAELVSRKNFCSVLINEYKESGYGEYETACLGSNSILTGNKTVHYELFLILMINYYHYDFSTDELNTYYGIREEKEILYAPLSWQINTFYLCPDMSSMERPVIKSVEEMRSLWYVNEYYPYLSSDKEWELYTEAERDMILNPPEDLASTFSSEKIVELIRDYPLLFQAYLYTQTPFDETPFNYCHCFLETHCGAYVEMLKRDDCFDIFLDFFEQNDLPSMYETDEDGSKRVRPEFYNEHIWYVLIEHFWNDMSTQQKDRYRSLLASKLQDGDRLVNSIGQGNYIVWTEPFFPPEEPEPQAENESVIETENEFTIENEVIIETETRFENDIENINRSYYPGFVGFGEYSYRKAGNKWVYCEDGNYGKYGEEALTYKYISGEFTAVEISGYDQSMSMGHSTWEYVSSASARYNCHSYAWIMRPTSNNYWLEDPEDYYNGTGITYKGASTDDHPPSLQNGDCIVICKVSDDSPNHSAIVSMADNDALDPVYYLVFSMS